jgi:hypothetical protein
LSKEDLIMRRSSTILLMVSFSLLIFGVAALGGDSNSPKITGSAHWEVPQWETVGKVEINVIYIAPNESKGHFNLIEKDPYLVNSFKAHAVCVAFGEGYYGEPATSVVLQIDQIKGDNPPQYIVGQYIKLWLSDGGTPASEGDFAGVIQPWGTDNKPPCDYELPFYYWPLNDGGNIVIHTGN